MLSFKYSIIKKRVCILWNKGIIFEKIFWWHEISTDFRENIRLNISFCENFTKIFVLPKAYAKICVREYVVLQ